MFHLTKALVWLTLSNTVTFTLTFDPGCSFIGGQCQYQVTLGHVDKCDSAAGTPNAPAADSTQVTQLQSDITDLQRQMSSLKESFQDLQKNGLPSTSQDIADLEYTLNRTKAQLETVMAQANKEIQGLRVDLLNVSRDLMTCQAALGVSTSDPRPASLSGDISQTYCGFNNGSSDWCIFSPLTAGNDFSLMRKGSGTQTGPKVDHSTGTLDHGQYFGLDSQANALSHTYRSGAPSTPPINTAKLESELLSPARGYCVMFWYMMRGREVQKLDVTVRIGGGVGYPVFTKTGDQGDQWLLGKVELGPEYTSHSFKIDFEATSQAYRYAYSSTSHSYYNRYDDADIAVDDVYVYNATCSEVYKCPDNAYMYTDQANRTTCYTVHTTPATWAEAADTCRREGAMTSLVAINDQAEQDFLVNLINSDKALRVVGENGFYTSGNDLYSEHNFRWTNRGVMDLMIFDNWHVNQPNNVGGAQDCLLMEYPEDGFSWGDVDCWTQHPFICEARYD